MNETAKQLGFDVKNITDHRASLVAKRAPCEVCHQELVRGDDCWQCPSGHVVDWDADQDPVPSEQ